MVRVVTQAEIRASAERVFAAITDFENLPTHNEEVLRVEFVSDRRSGLGTRFREVRRMGKRKELVTELEVTEYEAPHHVRMVADTHGTVWDTQFDVRPTAHGVELTMAMDARPHAWLQRFLTPLMKPLFARGMRKHMVNLKAQCESSTRD